MADWASMPRRIQLITLRSVAEMIVGPPGEPVTKLSLPSRRRMVGGMELSGRGPGPMASATEKCVVCGPSPRLTMVCGAVEAGSEADAAQAWGLPARTSLLDDARWASIVVASSLA